MLDYFSQLGRAVLSRWQAENFSPTRFSAIATDCVHEQPPAEHVALPDLIRDFLLSEAQPSQSQSGFGQPELIVFEHPRFYIQVLFWLEGATDIHQHSFSGAFHVLGGSSIHATFAFEDGESITAHLRVGHLRRLETLLLNTGSTVPILSGSAHIHSLFHLDTPSVTVVVRTQEDPGSRPQFTYLPPHLAVDPFHEDTLTARRKQLLDALEAMGDEGSGELVREMLASLDFERGFFILQNALGPLRQSGEWAQTWQLFAERHGRLAAFVEPTLDEIVRRDALVEMRRCIVEPEHRFFLALLLNLQGREEILRLVVERVAGDPVETVLRWCEELCEPSLFGVSILDAHFPETVEVDPERQPEVFLTALRRNLTDAASSAPAATGALTKTQQTALRAAFAESSLRALLEQ